MCNGNCLACKYSAEPWSERICMDPDSPKYLKVCEDESEERQTNNESQANTCDTCY